MGWKYEYIDQVWWAYDPDDGDLREYDDDDHSYDQVGYVDAGLCKVKHAVRFVPNMDGYRFRMMLPDGSWVFYDPKDGEWGRVSAEGENHHCGYHPSLIGVSAVSARELIDELSDSDEDDDEDEDDDDEDEDDDDDDEEDDEEEEDDSDDEEDDDDEEEDIYDDDSDEEDDNDEYFNRYDYILFPTVNEQGWCLGLSLYWIYQRLTENETVEETAIDYNEGRRMQEAVDADPSWDMSTLFSKPEVLDDDDLECEARSFVDSDAVEDALNFIFEEDGSYVLMFWWAGAVGHAVAVRTEEENAFFDANQGVFRLPSEELLRRLLDEYLDWFSVTRVCVVKMDV